MAKAVMRKQIMASPSTVRCAIYTRKSHEDGLEQDFNSLDAQREACAAYVLSQRHEGWTLVPEYYDDGGYSGGTMDRPGLQMLLADVTAGKVDVIVIYKIDRLTRSLTDFAKLAELFDAKGVSFVSVTQSFNTTTSMGRLMLNVLLSFAQFEREVTGERIRDKIAASKKKGLWMGGPVPLGYEVQDRKLVVSAEEADTVRMIFARYLDLGSVVALQGELKNRGIVSKQRTGKNGKYYGGHFLTRGALYLMLQNRIYRGDIYHKGHVYAGEHEAIVPADLFDEVQSLLETHRIDRKRGTNAKEPSLLAGLLWDAHGRRLSPSHAQKQAKRYRYYVSREEIPSADKPKWRIPASALEETVMGKLRQFLTSTVAHGEFLHRLPSAAIMEDVQARLAATAEQLAAPVIADRRALLLDVVKQIIVHEGEIEIMVNAAHLIPNHQVDNPNQTLTLIVAAQLVRAAGEVRLALPSDQDGPSKRDPALIKLIVRAHAVRATLNDPRHQSIDALTTSQNLTADYARRLLRLSTLAPDIVTAILDGRQPATLTREKLARATHLPHDWAGQRKALGFN